MIRRAFSKLSELMEISSKAKLPDLNPLDRERTIKDISSYFDIMMETALPNKNNNERPMLSQKDLNKMILL